MIRSLHIRNLALVVDLEVEFSCGLNTVTGETGAGKSLILGAVQLLVGGRAGAHLIRRGAERCDVSAVIDMKATPTDVAADIEQVLAEAGVDACVDGLLLIRRSVSTNGSRAYVNDCSVTAGLLRDIGGLLVDIHGPNEHQSLLRPRCQLDLLDASAETEALRQACQSAYGRCQTLRTALAAAAEHALSAQECELLLYQLQEIDAAALVPDEEQRLIDQHRIAANAQRLIQIAGDCAGGLVEEEGCIVDQLARFVRLLQELEATDPEPGSRFGEQLNRCISQVHELAGDLASYADAFEVDEEMYGQIDARLETIHRLKRKYGPTVEDVLSTAANSRSRLDAMENRAARLQSLEHELENATETHHQVCRDLSARRDEARTALAEQIAGKLHRLGFEQATFSISLTETEAGPTGSDRVEFCVAPNPGEPMLPLRQIASSGEIARVMLAVKTVLTQADRVPVLIFDEVDANIGGRVALTVAEELVAIGTRHQVLSITHLPQIAAAGQTHFQVSKQIQDGRTVTTMIALDPVAREQEILRMLGAPKASEAAVGHAREMLASAPGTVALAGDGTDRMTP